MKIPEKITEGYNSALQSINVKRHNELGISACKRWLNTLSCLDVKVRSVGTCKTYPVRGR